MPQLGAAVGPCAADLRDRRLTEEPSIRRAIAALRAGRPVKIDGDQPITIVAVETATPELLDLIDPSRTARLLISGERAAALALANLREAADPAQPVLIKRSQLAGCRYSCWRLPIPATISSAGQLGRLRPFRSTARKRRDRALSLARSAGLLPAVWIVERRECRRERIRG